MTKINGLDIRAYEQYGDHHMPHLAVAMAWSHAETQPSVHKGRPSVAELIMVAKQEVRGS